MDIFLRNFCFFVISGGGVSIASVDVAHGGGKKDAITTRSETKSGPVENNNPKADTFKIGSLSLPAEGIDVVEIKNKSGGIGRTVPMIINVFERNGSSIEMNIGFTVKNDVAIEDLKTVTKGNRAKITIPDLFPSPISSSIYIEIFLPKHMNLYMSGQKINVTLHDVRNPISLASRNCTIKDGKGIIFNYKDVNKGFFVVHVSNSEQPKIQIEKKIESSIKSITNSLRSITTTINNIEDTTKQEFVEKELVDFKNLKETFQEEIKKIAECYEKILEDRFPQEGPVLSLNKQIIMRRYYGLNPYMSHDKESSFLTAPMQKFCRKVVNKFLQKGTQRKLLLQIKREAHLKLLDAFQQYIYDVLRLKRSSGMSVFPQEIEESFLEMKKKCLRSQKNENMKEEEEKLFQNPMTGKEADLLKRDEKEEELFQKMMMEGIAGLLKRDEKGKDRPHPTNQKDGKHQKIAFPITNKAELQKNEGILMAEEQQPEEKTTVKPMQEEEKMFQKLMFQNSMTGEKTGLLQRDEEEELFQKLMMGERIGLLQRDENGKYRPHPTNQKDGKRYLNDILKKYSKLKDNFPKWVKMAEDKQPEKKTTVKPMQEEEKKDGGKGGKRWWYD